MKKLLTSALVFFTLNTFAQKVNKDTLIVSQNIKWIKIDGQLYEVKKTITLDKFNSIEGGGIIIDTMIPRRWFVNDYLPNVIYTQK